MMKVEPKVLLILICSMLSFISCQEQIENNTTTVYSEKISVNEEHVDSQKLDFSNPAVFIGTDFGNFIRALYGIGDFDQMIAFTSSSAIKRFGKDVLREYYRELDMRLEMKLLSTTKEDSLIILHYECIDKATRVVRRLPVIVENDSVKVHINQLKRKSLFLD